MEEKEIMEMAKVIMGVESKTHGVSHYVGAGMAMQIADKLQELGYRKADDLIAENEKLKKENYQLQQKLGECENGYEQTLFLERCKLKDALEKNEKLQKQLDDKCDRCIERAKKIAAKEVLEQVGEIWGDLDFQIKNSSDFQKITKKYGVEIET